MKLLDRLHDIWNMPAYVSHLETEVIKLKSRIQDLETDLIPISKLADLYTSRELAVSENALFYAEAQEGAAATADDLEATIDHLTSLRLSLEASPAIGGRMVRNKNTQLAEVNHQLAAAISARRKLSND